MRYKLYIPNNVEGLMIWSFSVFRIENNSFVSPTKPKIQYHDSSYDLSEHDKVVEGIYFKDQNYQMIFVPESHPYFNIDLINDAKVDGIFTGKSLIKLKEVRVGIRQHIKSIRDRLRSK